MTIKTKILFILIGDDRTGKTTLQKLLIEKICSNTSIKNKLPTNSKFNITHPEIKRKYKEISFGNRSYQEKINTYKTINNFFKNHFEDCDISFISSHLIPIDIEQMIINGKQRFFNVNAIFFSNSIEKDLLLNSQISELAWDERFLAENPITDKDNINNQLNLIAESIVDIIINRTKVS